MAKKRTDSSEMLQGFRKTTGADTKKATPAKKPQKQITAGRNVPVPLGQIKLDSYQPRQIIPVDNGIRDNYYSGANDWRKTAKLWIALAGADSGIDNQVKELLELGNSIQRLNQIEPATGTWTKTQDGENVFSLSTGERRFWSLALTAEFEKDKEEPQLVCQIIKTSEMNLERQIVENESAKPLSAVGKARAIAGLILEQIDQLPPELDRNSDNPPTDHEYYRSVLDVERITGSKQMPRGVWEAVGETIGMERPYMVRHLSLLKFPPNLQYKADIYEITEAALREVLTFPPGEWSKVIDLVAKQKLSAPEVKRIGKKKGKKTKADSPASKAASRLRAFWKITREIKTAKDIEQVATDFSVGLDKKEILDGAKTLEKLASKLRLRAEG